MGEQRARPFDWAKDSPELSPWRDDPEQRDVPTQSVDPDAPSSV